MLLASVNSPLFIECHTLHAISPPVAVHLYRHHEPASTPLLICDSSTLFSLLFVYMYHTVTSSLYGQHRATPRPYQCCQKKTRLCSHGFQLQHVFSRTVVIVQYCVRNSSRAIHTACVGHLREVTCTVPVARKAVRFLNGVAHGSIRGKTQHRNAGVREVYCSIW